MRRSFVEALTETAARDPRIVLLSGDIGYMALEPFAGKFPDRYFNVGIAEQNMVGAATGLAEAGFIPFVYSIATFSALRPYEFIRNGPVLHRLPVRVVGVGGGFEYGHNGITHYALEDFAVMRAQPGMTVVAPADSRQARSALLSTWDAPGPVYYRLGKDDKAEVPGLGGRFAVSGPELLPGGGGDVLILSAGAASVEAAAAAEELRGRGVGCSAAVLACLNPAPVESLAELFRGFKAVVTAEAHYVCGGLGSLAAEVIAERGLNCRLVRCAVRSQPSGFSGKQSYMDSKHGIDRASLAAAAVSALDAAPGRRD